MTKEQYQQKEKDYLNKISLLSTVNVTEEGKFLCNKCNIEECEHIIKFKEIINVRITGNTN